MRIAMLAACGLLFMSTGRSGAEAVAPPAVSARISVDAGKKLFQLSDLMIGANMEDLHYQMVGGFDSQLIHGESFFEPSPTQLASKSGLIDGFENCGGTVQVENGELVVRGKGTRLTSTEIAASAEIELNAVSGAGLALCVSPLNADNKWEWYSGYTAEVTGKEVILTLATRANKHLVVAKAPLATAGWVRLAIGLANGTVTVAVDGKEVLRHADGHPLPAAHWGLVARGDARFRAAVPFKPNPLLQAPGDAISLRWHKLQAGAVKGRFELETQGTWHANSPSQAIEFVEGAGELGIDNAGLKRWGIALLAEKPYEGFVRVKSSRPTEFWVSLRRADGAMLAEQRLATQGKGAFERLPFTLTPAADDAQGRFAVTLKQPGRMTLGYAFLQRGDWGRFKGLPVRKDLAEALLAQGIRVLRFNGGMIEVPGYRWRNLRGPRDERPPYDGFYDRYCSGGFGPFEAVAFGAAAGLPVVPALNLDETPEDVADFVAACKPYNLRFYQVANESRFNRGYVDKFKQVAEAVWQVAPEITLVTTSCGTGGVKADDTEARARERLALHLELLDFVQKHGKRLLFDCHDFGGAGPVQGIAGFSRWIKRLAAKPADVDVGILEFNAGAFDWRRGLNHALEMNAAYRNGDAIRAVGTPNVSQPWNVYQTDWKAVLWTQGNIYYTPSAVWFQPGYYVDQMIAQSWAPDIVDCEAQNVDAVAARTTDGKLVLRVVNDSTKPVAARLEIKGVAPAKAEARVFELAGDPAGYNTLDKPESLKPVHRTWRRQDTYAFPAHSFTILILE